MDNLNKKRTGLVGEKHALNYLKKKGFRILETNFYCKEGEIDIIAEKGKGIIFVEVRTKTSFDFGKPEESINEAKRKHIIRAAYQYLNLRHKLNIVWRVDFIAVELTKQGKILRIEHIENAISG